MIFSESFINVLSTFKNINPGMHFRVGNVQSTVGVNGGKIMTFFTRAFTDTEITQEFYIGQLSKLLGVIKMFNSPPEINVESNCLVVSGEGREIKVILTEPQHISFRENPDKIKVTDGFETVLTQTNLNDILQLYSVFNATHISFVGKGGKYLAIVSTIGESNVPTDQGVIELGETDAEFNATIQAVNFRVEKTKVGENYRLLVNKKGVVFLGTKTMEYYIPVEAKHSHF